MVATLEWESSECVPLKIIANTLANLCREYRSGTLYLTTPDNQSASFCLDLGQIVYIRFGSARNQAALTSIVNTAEARCRFSERSSYFGSRAELPTNAVILQQLGYIENRRSSQAARDI